VALLIRFFKPFHVLSQFTDVDGRATLSRYIEREGVYPAGRLDFDSEGLLLLTNSGPLQARIANPRHKIQKTYLAQIEGRIADTDLNRLVDGVLLADGRSRAVRAARIEAPIELPPRDPPVAARRDATSTWLKVVMNTGRNRQVRRMLAAVGHPVLRLIRTEIGPWKLAPLKPGQWTQETVNLPR